MKISNNKNFIMDNKLVSKKAHEWSQMGAILDIIGGEILKHIDSEILYAKFKKNPENGGWDNDLQIVKLDYIGDYDPMTSTYLAKMTTKEGEKIEIRIMSAGFEWGDPEEKGTTSRLIPLSHHYRLMENEVYYNRLRELYFKNQNVLGIEQLNALVGKEGKEALAHILWIAAVIDTDTEKGLKKGLLTFRIGEISSIFKRSKVWAFNLRDLADGSFMTVPKFAQEENGVWVARDFSWNGTVLGDLKIIDIENPKEDANIVSNNEVEEGND